MITKYGKMDFIQYAFHYCKKCDSIALTDENKCKKCNHNHVLLNDYLNEEL